MEVQVAQAAAMVPLCAQAMTAEVLQEVSIDQVRRDAVCERVSGALHADAHADSHLNKPQSACQRSTPLAAACVRPTERAFSFACICNLCEEMRMHGANAHA